MKDVKTYICMFLMIMGMCANAWGAGALTFTPSSLTFNGTLEDGIAAPDAKSITVRTSVAGWTAYLTDVENSDYSNIHYEHVSGDNIVYEINAEAEYTTSTGTIDGVNFLYFERTSDVGTISIDVTAIYAGTENLRLIVQAYDALNNLTTYYIPITVTITEPGSGHNITYHVPDCASNKPSNESNVAAGAHALPTNVNVDGYTFAGWTENGSYTDGTSAPTTLYTSSFTMPGDRDVELYAVYSQSQNVSASSISWSAYSGSPVADGDYVISNGQYAQNGTNTMLDNQMADRGTRIAAKSVTMTGGKITSEITSVAWHITKHGDYWTIYNPYANKYVAATANEKEATLVSDVTDAALWTIEKTPSTYNIINKSRASETAKYLKYNSTTNAWACYSGSSAIYLFVTDVNPFEGSTTYTINPECTTYSVTYDANGGTGSVPTDANKYAEGATAIVLGNVNGMTKDGFAFAGWATSSSATSATYHSGSELTISTSDVTLYAVWNTAKYSISYYDQDGASYSGSNEASLPTTHTYGTATDLVAGVKSGSTFDGWFTNPECTGVAVTSLGATAITDDVTLYAKWSERYTNFAVSCANETQITVNANNGTEEKGYCIVEEGTSEPMCYHPTYTGYEIVGFYTGKTTSSTQVYDADGTMVLNNDGYTDVTGWAYSGNSLTLNTVWQAKTYNITIEANGGDENKATTVKYDGTSLVSFTAPKRTGYTLDGYYTLAEGGDKVAEPGRGLVANVAGYTTAEGKWMLDAAETVTLYAHWTINSFSVVWYDVAGNEFASTTVEYGGSIDAPVGNPTCGNDKVFLGWTSTEKAELQQTQPTKVTFPVNDIKGARTYYPIFASRNGGKEGAEAIGKSEDFSAVATTGSYGNGYWTATDGQTWNYTNMKIGKAGLIASNGIYFAAAAERKTASIVSATKIADASKVVLNIGRSGMVTATLDYSEDGSVWNSQALTIGTSMADVEATLPQVGDYYIRLSISVEGTSQYVYVENIKVYTKARQWWYSDYSTNCNVAASATLTYADCELTAHAASPIPENVTLPTPEKTGFVFKYWHCEQTGHNKNYNAGETYVLAHDVTLTAVWTAKHTITYKEGDAEYTGEWASDPHPTEFVEGEGCTLVDAVKECYTFGGWYREADCSGTRVTKIATTITTDEVLYAKFTQDTYKVTFNANGHGTAPTALTNVPCGTTIESRKPADLTVSKWTFMGWYKESTCDNAWDWENDVVTANTTLYAYWVSTTHTITCQTKTGDGVSECKTVADVAAGTSSVVITLDDACIPAGYHLYDWEYTLSGGGTTGVTKDVENKTFTITTMPDKDVTVTALLISDLVISGNPVKLTSGNGIAVYTTGDDRITVSGEDLWAVEKIKITYLKGGVEVAKTESAFRLCDGDSYETMDGASGSTRTFNITDATRKPYSRVFAIQYQPTAANQMDDDYQLKLEAQLSNNNTVATAVFDLKGRSLPETFAIVMKNDGDKNWYALPNDLDASTSAAASTKAPVVVMVDNQTTPTKVTFGPSNALYQASDRYKSPDNNKGAIRFLRNGATNNAWITTSSTSQLYMPNNGAFNQNFNLTSSNFSDYLITQDGADGYRISMYGGTIGWYNTGSNTKVYLLPVEAELLPKEADIIEWGANGLVVEVDATNVAGMIATVGSESTSQLAMNQTQTSAGSATKYDYTFNLGALSLTDKADQVMLLQWKNNSDVVIGTTMVKVPRIINGNVVASEDAATKTAWTNYDKIVVLPGAKLTVDGATTGFKDPTLKCVEVYPGGKLNIASGTVQTNTLILRAGWSSNKQWAMPNVAIANTATLTKTNAYLDWYVDYHQYYPIAVPFPVTVANMSYVNTNSSAASGVTFKQYDGQQRAEQGQASVGTNWKEINPTTLTPSTGYAMTARRPSGKAWSIVRMPLTFTNAWTTNGEQAAVNTETKNVVNVTAYGVGGEQPWYCQGWNFVANPFMVPYNSSDEGLTGKLSFQNGGTVKYATIPDINFEGYDQWPIASANLQPMSGFFVQVATTGNIEFTVAGKQPMAAPMLAARAAEEEKGLSAEGYIKVSGNGQTDMFGLLVGDEYTAGNDLGSDLQKIIGDSKLRAYMIYNEEKMAYVALNEALAKEWIPVTVNVPANGSYQFALDENVSEIDELEGLYLMDNLMGTTTNLLYKAYEFEAEAGTLAGRFALNAIRKIADAPTDIEGVDAADGIKPRKIIYDDKLFILVGGKVYDGTGKLVNK